MKEIFKSKGMLLFIIFFLGVTYINSINFDSFESNYDNNIVMDEGDYQIKKSI